MAQKSAVAIVDDDESIREALIDLLDSYGFKSRSFKSAEQFLTDANRRSISCMLLDVNMPGRTGIQLQSLLVSEPNPPAMIFVTSCQDERTYAAAMKAGAVAFLAKPVNVPLLMMALEKASDQGDAKSIGH
ncbi:response regulator (plasmid) [Rhizobium sp. CC1099]|uniref:response regulator transcription factor n=1 Tax=Rhizobium sp. CC1099 TaxID=3039160 RepID=UPI0024B0B8D8|nr:response regulator [Rhizobium sp. CC1099]WFU91367.1 response regulator [Rhizobium sp. CC1099]